MTRTTIPWAVPLGLALALATAVPAAAFDYTYIEGGVGFANNDSPDRDGDGPWAAISLEANPSNYVFAHYARLNLDQTSGGAVAADEDAWGVGAGSHSALSRWADMVLSASYEQTRTQPATGRDDVAVGYAADLGMRMALRKTSLGTQEVNAGVAYRYLDSSGDTVFRAGVVVPLTTRAAVTGEARYDGDRWLGRAGVRVTF
jgi:hypothetical protein